MQIMSRHYIFTKQFFNLPPTDQAAVVDAAIHDLELAIGVYPADRRSILRTIRRIEHRAVQVGVYHSPEEVVR